MKLCNSLKTRLLNCDGTKMPKEDTVRFLSDVMDSIELYCNIRCGGVYNCEKDCPLKASWTRIADERFSVVKDVGENNTKKAEPNGRTEPNGRAEPRGKVRFRPQKSFFS